MASKEHLNVLKRGVEIWNQWRQRIPGLRPILENADLSGTDLSEANLLGADLGGANLLMADLHLARLGGATLFGANLREANLTKADLAGANLGNVHFHKANLREAYLRGASLSRANLREANLRGANLRMTNLRLANFRGADLQGADLREADLHGADLREADLGNTNLENAIFSETVLGNVNIFAAKGPETCRHSGPSTIDHHTLMKSPNLPLAFLRGVGLSDDYIEYLPAFQNRPIQYYSCFISYSDNDKAFAEQLYANLQAKGVRCWFAPEDMKIGDKIRPRLDESIRIYDKLLLILSEHSIASTWVEKEVETAFDKEAEFKKQGQEKTVLFPIRLDDAVMESKVAWAADIRRTRHIGDFRDWKNHDAYQEAFEHLLRDLKGEIGKK